MKRRHVSTTIRSALASAAAVATSPLSGLKSVLDDGSDEADDEMEAELSADPEDPTVKPIGAVLRVSPIIASRLSNTAARRVVEEGIVCVAFRCDPAVVRSGARVPDDCVDAIQQAVLAAAPSEFRAGDGEVVTKMLDEKGLFTVGVFFTATITT